MDLNIWPDLSKALQRFPKVGGGSHGLPAFSGAASAARNSSTNAGIYIRTARIPPSIKQPSIQWRTQDLAGVAQSVERVALMKRQPQGRGFEPRLRLFLNSLCDDILFDLVLPFPSLAGQVDLLLGRSQRYNLASV